MKKALSLLLAVLCLFSAMTLSVHAAQIQKIHVYELLKYDADGSTGMCRTIGIFFENQYTNCDSSKTITFQKSDGTVVAKCMPHSDNNRMLDLYTPDDSFGVVMNPTNLYYLVIPEGAYYTDDGILNAAYRGEYNGIYLTDTADTFRTQDLGITNFLAGKVADGKLYSGKLLVSASFDTLIKGKDMVLLYKVDGEKETLVGTYSITAYKTGAADVEFGGVALDRYASYKLHVQYGAFLAKETVINAHSDYTLSGKKLLGLSENYPAIDFLIAAFGADHWTLKAVDFILKALSFIKIVDKALYNDVKDYIKARK